MTATIDIWIRTFLAVNALLLSFLASPTHTGDAVDDRSGPADEVAPRHLAEGSDRELPSQGAQPHERPTDGLHSTDPLNPASVPERSATLDDLADDRAPATTDEKVPTDEPDAPGTRDATAGDRALLDGDGRDRGGSDKELLAAVSQPLFSDSSSLSQDMTTGGSCEVNCIKQGIAIAWSTGTWIEVYTTVPTSYYLEVSGPGYEQSRSGYGGATLHIDKFEGLLPGTTYDAWVRVTDTQGHTQIASGSFTTPS